MKKQSKTLLVTLILSNLILSSFQEFERPLFYYAFDGKVYLQQNDKKLVVRFSTLHHADTLINRANSFKWHDQKTLELSFASKEIRDQVLVAGFRQKEIASINPVYVVENRLERCLTNEILLQFKKNITMLEQKGLIDKNNLTLIRENQVFKQFIVPDKANALEVANSIQESGLVVFSHPNFISLLTPNSIPNDTYFDKQFYLNNTGQSVNGFVGTSNADINAPEAWGMTIGSSDIIVAQIDCGLTSDHPDLPNSRQVRLNGSNFANDGNINDPSPLAYLDGGHGNAVAGIIGATQNNNEGISGICPNCKILPVRIFNSNLAPTSDSQIANAILFAANNGASVINNSWSYNSSNPNLVPAIVSAISYATIQGRSGKGCVMTFSIGNNADHESGQLGIGYISFPGNVNISGVLTVGASGPTDHQANYSGTANPGSPNNQLIDVVAPSSPYTFGGLNVWSMDGPGNLGVNPVPVDYYDINYGTIAPSYGTNNLAYTAYFGGTSAAAAEVSGVAALVLSLNSNLTQQQVYNIVTSSADKVGGYTYTNGRSNELGFGRLNACSAALQALNSVVSLSSPSSICTTGQFSIQSLPPGINVSWSSNNSILTVNSSGLASRVYNGYGSITASILSACGTITLTSPSIYVGTPYFTMVTYDGALTPSTCEESSQPYTTGLHTLTALIAGGYPTFTLHGPSTVHGTAAGNDFTFDVKRNDIIFDISYSKTNACGTTYGCTYFSNSGGQQRPVRNGASTIMIYPNPVQNQLTIEQSADQISSKAGSGNISARLYDSFSRLAKSGESTNGKLLIDTGDLPKGVYYLNVFYNGETIGKQILKDK